VVSYFLRYFSSTSTEQISPVPPDLSPVSIRLALLFLLFCGAKTRDMRRDIKRRLSTFRQAVTSPAVHSQDGAGNAEGLKRHERGAAGAVRTTKAIISS
jgi:hypothetical protein